MTEPQQTDPPQLVLSEGQKLAKHAVLHTIVVVLALSLWAATDAWYLLTRIPLATFLTLAMAALAGVIFSTLVHEWFHFAGARLSGSSYTVPERTRIFVYDYDYPNNSVRQFNIMSLAGQAGSWIAVLALVFMVPLDNPGRWMLVAGAVGSAVFGGAIEWPVLLRTRDSGNPLAELSKITPSVFGRSLLIGAGSGVGFWYLAA